MVFGVLFVLAGVCHFVLTDQYLRIMPPVFPAPRFLVLLSGACEIGLGAALLLPGWSALAAWGMIALLLAVFPANIYMAIHPELFPKVPGWLLWARLPLQGVLIWWAALYTRTPPR